ncbi:MAG TPA: amidohydrolase family protein [Alphaproteobacteria bacterium]|nr:amidohydrolase family protein [Alphaproteobacteria bacterium]
MHEFAIRGGTVIDGTGACGRKADIGISGGRIREIAPTVAGRSELDASGQLVVPGFIDLHTHYDPQVLWDPRLAASSVHGVTSVVAGNCGFSLAPVKPSGREILIGTLDKVEDMNAATLQAGIDWDFETYPEYLEAVERRGLGINFGGFVGHTAVRAYVMGEASYERPATDAEIAAMKAVVAESIRGGALGFSTDRAGFILGHRGRPVPSVVATQDETEALMRVTAEIGRGIVHVAPGEDYRWLFPFQRSLGRTVNWSALLTYPPDSGRGPFREKLAALEEARRGGADIWAQVTCRPILQLISLLEPYSFSYIPAFAEVIGAPRSERGRFYTNAAWRARVKAELARGNLLPPRWNLITIAESDTHAMLIGKSIAELSSERGAAPFDAMCDIALEDHMRTRFGVVFANDDEDGIRDLLCGSGCILGLSDAGAHVAQICDAVLSTDFLASWVRDRGVMSIEAGIHKLTGEPARVLGIDRGTLRVGAPADIVVLDLDALAVGPVRRVCDMPAEGERLIADLPGGITHVLVNGTPIRRDGTPIHDARPGTILRSC